MYDLVTLISLGLTPMTILSGLIVIYLFWSPFKKALTDSEISAVSWMIVGVVINFIGGVFDNLWWGIAWSADYVNHESTIRDYFFSNGVYSNTVFRQICGLIGAMCHIKSAMDTDSKWIKKVSIFGAALGFIWVGVLVIVAS